MNDGRNVKIKMNMAWLVVWSGKERYMKYLSGEMGNGYCFFSFGAAEGSEGPPLSECFERLENISSRRA